MKTEIIMSAKEVKFGVDARDRMSVSYTHLTLPTILRV